jgi:hypothetical protein
LAFFRFHRLAWGSDNPVLWKTLLGSCLVPLVLGIPRLRASGCSETPSVLMDERTAETHLLSKRDPVLPAQVPGLARVRKVVLLVTVDRQGVICNVRPVAGPKALRRVAVQTVKKHWRYRPFLVDWKPVVARFPVSVRFVLPQEEPRLTARRGEVPWPPGKEKAL